LGTLAEGLQSKYLQPKPYIANALTETVEGRDQGREGTKEEKRLWKRKDFGDEGLRAGETLSNCRLSPGRGCAIAD